MDASRVEEGVPRTLGRREKQCMPCILVDNAGKVWMVLLERDALESLPGLPFC